MRTSSSIGHAAIKCGFVVLYRSVFDLARDFMNEELPGDESNRMLTRYPKPDLLIIDDMGMGLFYAPVLPACPASLLLMLIASVVGIEDGGSW